ncbi:MAG: FHA domain-containing protein [Anaerolineales bacterium]
MKKITVAFSLVFLIALGCVFRVQAQSSESIWLVANTNTYKTGETVIVTVNASATTPVQGFTFQIRYDPACLRPVNASSPISGMNGLPMPQLAGLVDGSYASTTPQTVNGALAEVRFTTLKGCQTVLSLESAALAVRNVEGFAAPLANVAMGERNVSLNIDSESVAPQPAQPESGSILPLEPPPSTVGGASSWIIAAVILLLFGGIGLGANKILRSRNTSRKTSSTLPRKAALHVKHGPQAGKSFVLNKLPCLIGRDPQNDICINDPHVNNRHAQIYSERNGYYLRDLGGGTFINGHAVKSNTVVLHPGDVVRFGRSALFVFG